MYIENMVLGRCSPYKSFLKIKGMILVVLWNFSVFNVYEYLFFL